MEDEEKDYQPVTKVFAFAKGSIDTSYMVGEHVEPLNTKYPSFFRYLCREIKFMFSSKKRNLEKECSD